jgi:AhpD family alkylhydroperoxidase
MFDKAAMAAGAIPVKYKELMALEVAFTTQCPYCIEIHSKRAREAGVSDQELAEAVTVEQPSAPAPQSATARTPFKSCDSPVPK